MKTKARITDMDIAECFAEHIAHPCLTPCLAGFYIRLAEEQLQGMQDPDAVIMLQDAIRFGRYYYDALCEQHEQRH